MVAEPAHGDGRVDVVERSDRHPRLQHLIQRGDSVRKIGTYHGHVRLAQLGTHPGKNLSPGLKDSDLAIRRTGQVTIALIPLLVALEEDDAVSAAMQRLAQGAKSGGVPVAPGGGNRESENNDLHSVSSRPPRLVRCSMRSS